VLVGSIFGTIGVGDGALWEFHFVRRRIKLIEDHMTRGGYPTADDVVLAALESLDERSEVQLDEETVRAIEEGEAQLERGEGRPWDEVREELKAKLFRK